MRPEEPAQAIVDDLADRLGASILAEDPAERVIAYSAQQGPIDQVRQDCILARAASPAVVEFFSHYGLAEAEGPLRTPSEPQLGLLGRLCVPVRSHRRLLGYLWIIDDAGSLGADAERSALDAARRLALVLEEQERLASLRSDLVGQLLSESPELVAHAAGVVLERRLLPAPGGCVACVLHAGAGLEPARAAGVLTEIAAELATPLVAADEHSAVAIVPAGRDRPGRDVVAATADALRRARRRADPGHDGMLSVVAGVGDPQADPSGARDSHRQARLAARAAAAVPALGGVARWDRLGAYRVLLQLPGATPLSGTVDPRLEALLAAGDPELSETLEAYLDLAGDAKATAETLSLHRGGLYYRLAKIERITGCDLHDGGDRLSLHLGLKLARLRRDPPERDAPLRATPPRGRPRRRREATSDGPAAPDRAPGDGLGRSPSTTSASPPGNPASPRQP